MREAVRGIIYPKDNNDEIIVIKREKKITLYYVFPGGGIEKEDRQKGVLSNCINGDEEIRKNALKRDIKEELGIEIEIYQKFATFEYNTYYICKQVNGEIGTGTGTEYDELSYATNGTYMPMCIKITELDKYNLVPAEIKNKFLEYRRIIKNI